MRNTFTIGLLFCLTGVAFSQNNGQDKRSAKQIIEQMAKTYLTCTTYSDTGILAGGSERATFSTAFIRYTKFRFEYKSNSLPLSSHYIIWGDGNNVTFSTDYPFVGSKKEMMPSLGDAVASGTGVTMSIAHRIPVLLLPKEVGGTSLNDLTNLRRLPDSLLGKTLCYRLSGTFFGNSTDLWIDKKTFLLLQIQDFNGATTYAPVINSPVTGSMLKP